jgi:ATP-dependent helicase Lhr and Lhr-like helicase
VSVLDRFHPLIRAWFQRRFAAPSRVQQLGWPAIADTEHAPGHDVLLCAPTGSGKTLAAFMWAINRLVLDAEQAALRDEVSVLYVSPLKALANDIRLNLEEPLAGIRETARESGVNLAPLRAGLRTGDTPAGERASMLRRPPHILVTTPESLFILLTSPRFREKLRAVRYVIVDELHAIAGNKRGAHLMLTLERLERMVRRGGLPRPARIGLSATLNPIATLAAFLAGAEVDPEGKRNPRPIRIVRADDNPRQLDLAVIAPGPELGSLATHQHWEAMYDALAGLIRDHRTTLVFTLSRRWAERIALALQKRVGANAVMAHHGSLARAQRLDAEQRLKRGELKAIVATASLELGIDVGVVDLVCQIDSPKSISAAIQRIGRSGHHLGATPKGRFFALTLDDLLECAAAVRAIRLGHLDEIELPEGCLDVAAQQIVAIAAEEDDIAEAELIRIIRAAHNFASFDLDALRGLLAEMAAQLPDRIQGANPKIFYDRANGRIRPRRGARLAAITSGGTIPESGNLDVVIASEGRKIGDVEEDFAQESSRGDIFSLGSMPWRVLGISKNRFMVEAAPGMAPSLPFWQVEAGGRSPAMSAEICDVRRRIAIFLTSSLPLTAGEKRPTAQQAAAKVPPELAVAPAERAAAEWLMSEGALDQSAATQAVAYVRRGIAALGAVPDERTLVLERFFDGLGGTQIVIHSPLGMRLNRGFGLALRKRLCQSFDFEIQASAIDDAVLLALNSRHSFPLDHILTMLNSRTLRATLVQALLDAPMFEVRFRHVATRALAVMRSMRGRKVPAWIQRLRTQELITALFPQRNACFDNRPAAIDVPHHFMVHEAVSECLHETADLSRLEKLLAGLEDGSVRTVFVDNVAPSVFAHRVLLAWDYSFLDDGERANRRSRTVSMNRAMAEDVFRSEDLAEVLSAEAVERVAAEVDGRAPSSRARDADELCELIRTHGALPCAHIDDHVAGDAAPMLASLVSQGRLHALCLAPSAPDILITTDDRALFAAAYPAAAISVQVPLPDRDFAREEIVRRALATSAPTTAPDLATRLCLTLSEVNGALVSLEARGAIFRGHFTTAPAPTEQSHTNGAGLSRGVEQWCDRYVLERIHRQTLSRLRSEVEPCTEEEFADFRLKWQQIDDADAQPSVERVRAVLTQMAGLAYPPELWERVILPARVPDYRPEHLDLLCMSGEFAWVATPFDDDGVGATADFPARVAFLPRGAVLAPPSRAIPDDARVQAVYGSLAGSGALHLDRVADRAGLSERDTLAALWRLAAAGLVSNDSFAPLRLLWSDPDTARALGDRRDQRPSSRHDAALRARLKSSLSGRWSLVESCHSEDSKPVDETLAVDHARELALLLLKRHGVLTREMLALEQVETSWQELLFALRRMEYAGLIRRGWFVRALSGEQYALPDALELLRARRASGAASKTLIALSAADPTNPYGVLLPGCGIPREPANSIVIRAGRVVMGLAGRVLLTPAPLDDESYAAALSALMKLRPRLAIETIDAAPALESPRVSLMAAMRFHSDGRALIYDGLPGPMPSRAIIPRPADEPVRAKPGLP